MELMVDGDDGGDDDGDEAPRIPPPGVKSQINLTPKSKIVVAAVAGMINGPPRLVYLVWLNQGSSSGSLEGKKARPITRQETKSNSTLGGQDKGIEYVFY